MTTMLVFDLEKVLGGIKTMKKIFQTLLVLTSLATLSACGADSQTSSSSSTGSSANEETDATSAASGQEYTDPSELADSYDVVIVGAGGAGMAAAIQAKEAGANPVILEKMPISGGNTLKSSAGMNASETKFQEAEGIEDSNDLFYEETLAGGHNTNDEELLRYFVDHSAEAIDWLDSMGITLDNLTTTGGMSEKGRTVHRMVLLLGNT